MTQTNLKNEAVARMATEEGLGLLEIEEMEQYSRDSNHFFEMVRGELWEREEQQYKEEDRV